MKRFYKIIESINLNILIFLTLIYLFFFKQYKARKVIKDLNEKGLCMYEIMYILQNGKRYPCNEKGYL